MERTVERGWLMKLKRLDVIHWDIPASICILQKLKFTKIVISLIFFFFKALALYFPTFSNDITRICCVLGNKCLQRAFCRGQVFHRDNQKKAWFFTPSSAGVQPVKLLKYGFPWRLRLWGHVERAAKLEWLPVRASLPVPRGIDGLWCIACRRSASASVTFRRWIRPRGLLLCLVHTGDEERP